MKEKLNADELKEKFNSKKKWFAIFWEEKDKQVRREKEDENAE